MLGTRGDAEAVVDVSGGRSREGLDESGRLNGGSLELDETGCDGSGLESLDEGLRLLDPLHLHEASDGGRLHLDETGEGSLRLDDTLDHGLLDGLEDWLSLDDTLNDGLLDSLDHRLLDESLLNRLNDGSLLNCLDERLLLNEALNDGLLLDSLVDGGLLDSADDGSGLGDSLLNDRSGTVDDLLSRSRNELDRLQE